MPNSDGFRGITMEKYGNHVMRFKHPMFRTHHSFLFILENYMHRKIVLSTFRNIYASKYFKDVAVDIGDITCDDLRKCAAHYEKCRLAGESVTLGKSCSAAKIRKLLKCLRTYGGRVPGTQYERQRCKYEIQGTIYHFGIPQLFVTWNPADTHSAMVVHFGDREIPLLSYDDIERILPNARVRAAIVSEDPASVAEFFHTLIRAAMHCFFGWTFTYDGAEVELTVISTFGPTRALYGTIETQGRGSLHIHLLVWLFNIDEIDTLTEIGR